MPKIDFRTTVLKKTKGSTTPLKPVVKGDKVVYGVSSTHPHLKRKPLKYKPVTVVPITAENKKTVYGLKETSVGLGQMAVALPPKSETIPNTITPTPKEAWRK